MIVQLIYFIVCHGVGPADHLATISGNLEKDGYEVQFYTLER